MENAKDTLKAAAFNIEEDDLKGFEQINSNTMSVPFIRIIQKGSPQINREKPEFIQGAQAGEWFNTVTKDVYGDAIRLIVLNYDHIYIEWRPDREGFVGYHTVENAERLAVDKTFGKWKTKDGNLLQENYDWLIFAIHNAETRQRALQSLRMYFRGEHRNGGLDNDVVFEKAAVIKLDREFNPDDIKAAGEMVCHIALKLPDTVERFVIQISKQGIFESVG